MRHRKKFNHLGRKKGHRNSMLANMACSLIDHKRINTTLAKAKALKKFVEPLITKSKSDTTHNRRIVFSRMKQKNAVAELFRDVAVKVADRPGGYTRIIRLGNRLGDNAEMAMIELVDYNDTYVSKKKKLTRRSRRGNKKAEETNNDVLETATDESAITDETPTIETYESLLTLGRVINSRRGRLIRSGPIIDSSKVLLIQANCILNGLSQNGRVSMD